MNKVIRMLSFDFITNKTSNLILLGFYFVFALYYAYSIGDLNVVPVSLMLWMAMTTGLPFLLRDKYGLDYLLASFPMKRITVVRGRYLYSLVMGALGISLSEIIVCLLNGFLHIGFDMKRIIFHLCISFLLYSILVAISLPLFFRFAHFQLVMVMPLFVYFLYIRLYFSEQYSKLDSMMEMLSRFPILEVIGTLLSAGVVLTISYILSCKIYVNRDL